MINNSPPDGSTCTPTPPAGRDGTFYANKSSCLKTFTFLIGLFMGKICFWVTLCQKGILRCPPTPEAGPGCQGGSVDPLTEERHKGGHLSAARAAPPVASSSPAPHPPPLLSLGPHRTPHRPILCFPLSFLWQHACEV